MTTTFSGTISGNVGVTMSASGGTLLLSGANNTFTGGVTVQLGILQLNNSAAAGTGTLTFTGTPGGALQASAGGVVLYNPVVFNGPVTISGGNSFTIDGPVTLGPSFATLTMSQNVTINGVISGPSALLIAGGSTLTLNYANTYSGNTTLGGTATLTLGNNNALGSGTLTIGTGTNLSATVAVTIPNNVPIRRRRIDHHPDRQRADHADRFDHLERGEPDHDEQRRRHHAGRQPDRWSRQRS